MARSIAPLSITQFTEYILVPHIACKLIQEDLSCDAEAAYKAMIESADVGASMYPVDDGDGEEDTELERILRSNIRAAKNRNMNYDSDDQGPGITYEVIKDNLAMQLSNSTATRPKPRQVRAVQARAVNVAAVSAFLHLMADMDPDVCRIVYEVADGDTTVSATQPSSSVAKPIRRKAVQNNIGVTKRVTRSQRAKVSLVSLSIGRLKVSARHPSRLRFLWATLAVLCCNHLGCFHLHRSYSSSTCLARCGLPAHWDKALIWTRWTLLLANQGPGLKQAPSCRLTHVILFSILYDCLGFRNRIEFIHTHDNQ